ncbi:MAG: Rrf2 family transcriptional regulator [Brumimicrobium sp.]
MISQTSKIAIKATVYLSSQSAENKKASIDEVAENIQASKHTVAKTLQKLVKAGIINSVKGPYGGFFIDEKQLKTPIYNLVNVIEGDSNFTRCGMGMTKCSEKNPCPLHDDYKPIKDLMLKLFKEKRIEDLSEPVLSGIAFLSH